MKRFKFKEKFNYQEFLTELSGGILKNYFQIKELFINSDNLNNWSEVYNEYEKSNGKIPDYNKVRKSLEGKYIKLVTINNLGLIDKYLNTTYIMKIDDFIDYSLIGSGFVYESRKEPDRFLFNYKIELNKNNLSEVDNSVVQTAYILTESEFNKIIKNKLTKLNIVL